MEFFCVVDPSHSALQWVKRLYIKIPIVFRIALDSLGILSKRNKDKGLRVRCL